MTTDYLNPPGLFDAKPFGFSQLVVSRAHGMAWLAGQTAWDTGAKLIGGMDFGAQLRAALDNIRHALDSLGATPRDVVRVRVYIVDHVPANLEIVGNAMTAFFGADSLPASTLLGVARLAVPEFLVEIDADILLPSG